MNKDKNKYEELAQLLEQAASTIDALEQLDLFCPYDSPTEFSSVVRQIAAQVKKQEHSSLRKLITIFGPTCHWDDAIGSSGMKLANHICALLDQLK